MSVFHNANLDMSGFFIYRAKRTKLKRNPKSGHVRICTRANLDMSGFEDVNLDMSGFTREKLDVSRFAKDSLEISGFCKN